ncbi:MAG: hypothetical protein KIT10_02205 [Flavobacteriales bacterium]|nr:hypothetical protein [Flavobacteriales bacterium]
MSKDQRKRMDLAFAALLSEDDAQALEAITRIRAHGDARAIPPLLQALARTTDETRRHRINALLHEVKAEGATLELIAALDDPTLFDIRAEVVAVLWNAGLDVRDHLERLVALAITGDAPLAFEVLTVVEHQEVWPEKAARRALKLLRDAEGAEPDSYKATMLRDMAVLLEQRLGVA